MPERNILIVACDFPPAGGPGVQRPLKFCKYLPQFGYRPLVLTVADSEAADAGDHTLLDEIPETRIFRCGSFRPRFYQWLQRCGLEMIPKAMLLASPDIGSFTWNRTAAREARRIAKQNKIDLLFTTTMPFSSAVLGTKLKKMLGIPWVLDYRDPWTTEFKLWPSRLHYLREVRQERQALEAADAVVVVTPTMKSMLEETFPESRGKVRVITNGFDSDDISNVAASIGKETSDGGPLRIAYTGSVEPYGCADGWQSKIAPFVYGEMQDDSTRSPLYLFRAVRALLDERPEWNRRISLELAGRSILSYRPVVRELRLEDVVTLHGYLPHAESVRLLIKSDVLLLVQPTPQHGKRSCYYSGKVFEYFCTEKPILALLPEGDGTDLIRRAGAGWCVGSKDVPAIAALLARLIEAKASGALTIQLDKDYVAQFERRNLTRRLAELFDSLVAGGSGK